ncbi:MAG TPA: hypothetical protein EYQ63_08290 [Fuerstia sp.]|nr:hypothetical protein [Fuerstiella sp.]
MKSANFPRACLLIELAICESFVVPDGVVPDGVVPDGVVPDGVVPDGVVPISASDSCSSVSPESSPPFLKRVAIATSLSESCFS